MICRMCNPVDFLISRDVMGWKHEDCEAHHWLLAECHWPGSWNSGQLVSFSQNPKWATQLLDHFIDEWDFCVRINRKPDTPVDMGLWKVELLGHTKFESAQVTFVQAVAAVALAFAGYTVREGTVYKGEEKICRFSRVEHEETV